MVFRKAVKGSEGWDTKREPRREPAKQRAQRARKRSTVYDTGQRFTDEVFTVSDSAQKSEGIHMMANEFSNEKVWRFFQGVSVAY